MVNDLTGQMEGRVVPVRVVTIVLVAAVAMIVLCLVASRTRPLCAIAVMICSFCSGQLSSQMRREIKGKASILILPPTTNDTGTGSTYAEQVY